MRLRDWLAQAADQIPGSESLLEAQIIAGAVLGRDRTWVLANPEFTFDPEHANQMVNRRVSHEPLAYILGYREFFGRRFQVGPGVLIPRQETEVLVDLVLDRLENPTARVLDLGTGSGCIGITLALERPQWSVTLSDFSTAALDVARQNAAILRGQVQEVLSDKFAAVEGKPLDAVVSNPPYVVPGTPLAPELMLFEPSNALFDQDADGLGFFRSLLMDAPDHLVKGGYLFVELGFDQAERAVREATSRGWEPVERRKDLSGIERAFAFRLP